MPSPNFDNLNKELSVLLCDPVAAAANNGYTYTSDFRSHLLNRAQSIFWTYLYNTNKKLFYVENTRLFRFSDFLSYNTFTSDSTSKILIHSLSFVNGQIVEILQVACQSPTIKVGIVDHTMHVNGASGDSSFQPTEQAPKAHLYRDGANFYIYIKPDSTTFRTKNFLISFLKSPYFSLSVGGSSDIEWSNTFWEDLKQLALAQALLYDGNKEGYLLILTEVFNKYAQDFAELTEKAVQR